jgi:glycosyltransferase involved in cell wall biosynthesis
VGVAHPGLQHAPQTALALQEAGWLAWYATSFYFKRSAWPDRALALLPPLRRRAERSRLDSLDDRLVRRALETDLVEKLGERVLSNDAKGRLQVRRSLRFPRRVLRLAEREPVDVLWAPHTSLEAFEALKPRGVRIVVDQSTGHPASLHRIQAEEYERHPDFFASAPRAPSAAAIERQQRVAELADLIVVGSAFAASTFVENGVDAGKLRVVPYGYDERLFPAQRPQRAPIAGRPVEFVFVGRVGAMKGAAFLLEAFRRVDPSRARLTLIGALDMPRETFARYAGSVTWLGQAPHADIPRLMGRADCLVFPSLFEGGGIVLYEAAAAALGVIQSDACGDGVRGDNGVVVPRASAEALAAAIETATRGDQAERWADASWRIHAERSWARYRQTVAETVRALVGEAAA